jgi:hypothetical protein
MSTGSEKPMSQQYRDNMPESLGGRPPTVAESAKEKIDDETRSAKQEFGTDKSLVDKGKEMYRDNMPEALGGRPPTIAEKGKYLFEEGKQRVSDEARVAKEKLSDETQTAKERLSDEARVAKEKFDASTTTTPETRAPGTEKSIIEQGKEVYRENMPEVLGGRPPTMAERAKERVHDEARSVDREVGGGGKGLLAKGKELYRETMPEVLGGRPPTVGEEFKAMVDTSKQRTQHTDVDRSLDGQMEDLSIDNRPGPVEDSIKDKPITQQLKAIYKENMPEALGGRPATISEKAQQRVGDEMRSAKEIGGEYAEKAKAKLDNSTER